MKKKTKRRKTVERTDYQIALTCTSARQAYSISDGIGREYLKLHLDVAIEAGIVKEIPKDKEDESIRIEHTGFPDACIGDKNE